MSVRTVVTVALAAAILAASLPAVDRARVQHADARVAGEVERLERAARALAAANDPVGDDGQPARRHVTLRLPIGSWGATGLERLYVPPPAGTADVRWRVRGGETRSRHLADLHVAGPPEGLSVDDGGRRRVLLELCVRDGRRTVVVRRPIGDQ